MALGNQGDTEEKFHKTACSVNRIFPSSHAGGKVHRIFVVRLRRELFSKIIVLFGRNSSSDPILTATENTGRKLADFAECNMYMLRHLDIQPTHSYPSTLLVTNSIWLRLKNNKHLLQFLSRQC